MPETLRHLLKHAAEPPLLLASLALFVMMAMTFVDVVLRSTINAPIEAATEMTRILMAVVVFSALPVACGRGQQISVDLLDNYFWGWGERIRDVVINILCGVMLFWPAERVMTLAERARSYGDVTEYLGIPQHYIAWFIAILSVVTAIILVLRGVGILIWGAPNRD